MTSSPTTLADGSVVGGAMIAVGAALVAKFSWVIYVFGGFLICSGIKMLLFNGKPDSVTDGEHFHFYVLGVIGAILIAGVVTSLAIPQSKISHHEPR